MTMAHWNYRAVQFGSGDEAELIMCEVYYDADDNPKAYKFNAAASGSTFDELRADLDRMRAALDKPRLKATDFPDAPRYGAN
jgi:hypothetical protein